MKRLLFALGLFFCALNAGAQTTTFNGVVKDLTNTPVPTGQVTFTLKPGIDTTISGSSRFVPATTFCEIHNPGVVSTSGTGTITVVVDTAQNWLAGDSLIFVGTADATLNASSVASPYTITTRNSSTSFVFTQSGAHTNGAGGTVGGLYKSGGTGACAVMQNTALIPANTSYTVGIQAIFAQPSSFNTYAIGSGPVDISTVVPTPSQIPAYSFVDTFSVQTITSPKAIRTNPSTNAISNACGLTVVVGPPGFSIGNPVANNCVAIYAASQAISGIANWAFNPLITIPAGNAPATGWAIEADVNVFGTQHLGAFGVDAVTGGSNQANDFPAFRCLSSTFTIIPIGAWRRCLTIQGVTDAAFFFAASDGILQLTQAVTGSGSPQTVTTNGVCTAPNSQLFVGTLLAVDTGGQQEDVNITNAACSLGVFSITGIFTKNHANPTNFMEYTQRWVWDARNVGPVAASPGYIWGSVKRFCDSNTPSALGFGVIPAGGGVPFTTEYYDCTNHRAFRDLGGGFLFQNAAAVPIAQLSSLGQFQPLGGLLIGSGISTAAPVSGSTGFQHKRVASCTTGAAAGSTCTTTVTWTSAFADGNYTATCTVGSPTNVPYVVNESSQIAASVVVTIANLTAVAASGTIECGAVHD